MNPFRPLPDLPIYAKTDAPATRVEAVELIRQMDKVLTYLYTLKPALRAVSPAKGYRIAALTVIEFEILDSGRPEPEPSMITYLADRLVALEGLSAAKSATIAALIAAGLPMRLRAACLDDLS